MLDSYNLFYKDRMLLAVANRSIEVELVSSTSEWLFTEKDFCFLTKVSPQSRSCGSTSVEKQLAFSKELL